MGKGFAYYDQEARESHPWGEPAERPIVIKDQGRFKRVYEDGTLAEGYVSPAALGCSVEIGGLATKAFEIPEDQEARLKAAELYGLHGQELTDFISYGSEAEAA